MKGSFVRVSDYLSNNLRTPGSGDIRGIESHQPRAAFAAAGPTSPSEPTVVFSPSEEENKKKKIRPSQMRHFAARRQRISTTYTVCIISPIKLDFIAAAIFSSVIADTTIQQEHRQLLIRLRRTGDDIQV